MGKLQASGVNLVELSIAETLNLLDAIVNRLDDAARTLPAE